MKKHYLECMCEGTDHITRFQYFKEDNESILYMESFLAADHRFFHRIWKAIKYVFGIASKYRSCYAQTSKVLINKDEATELRDFLNEFIQHSERLENERKERGKCQFNQ